MCIYNNMECTLNERILCSNLLTHCIHFYKSKFNRQESSTECCKILHSMFNLRYTTVVYTKRSEPACENTLFWYQYLANNTAIANKKSFSENEQTLRCFNHTESGHDRINSSPRCHEWLTWNRECLSIPLACDCKLPCHTSDWAQWLWC